MIKKKKAAAANPYASSSSSSASTSSSSSSGPGSMFSVAFIHSGTAPQSSSLSSSGGATKVKRGEEGDRDRETEERDRRERQRASGRKSEWEKESKIDKATERDTERQINWWKREERRRE